MLFSVGVLYSAQEFLGLIDSVPSIDLGFPNMFKSFSVAAPQAVLEVSQKCEWIQVNINGHLELTERGKCILLAKHPDLALRIQLGHLIETYLPPWLPLLSRGRLEAKKYLQLDVVQCFKEAGLFDSATDDVVNWWDKYSKVSRRVGKDNRLELGRVGEKLSLKHERERTEQEPVWQGFESNFAGFDILSVVDKNNSEALKIEVKCSNSSKETATFFVTKNEWDVATTSRYYLFHLWSLQPKPILTIRSVNEIQSHIPLNQGQGKWEYVSIPFVSFLNAT